MRAKAITLTQPFSYLAGVVLGDGWVSPLTLGLRVKDYDFAAMFAQCVLDVFGITVSPRRDDRGYWLCRSGNKSGRFNALLAYEPNTPEEKGSWLRGMFDSEGNASLRLNGTSARSYGRRVAFYSTHIDTLLRASSYLSSLGMPSHLRPTRNSAGHKGSKVVYELALAGKRENYTLFSSLVGSSIQRKQCVLSSIPGSYRPDWSQHCREAQAAGVAVRWGHRAKTVSS